MYSALRVADTLFLFVVGRNSARFDLLLSDVWKREQRYSYHTRRKAGRVAYLTRVDAVVGRGWQVGALPGAFRWQLQVIWHMCV